MTRHRALAGACLALAVACSGPPDASDQAPALIPSSPPTSLVRLPAEGGVARAYTLPDLAEAEWRPEGRLPELDSLVGINTEQSIVFARDTRGSIASVDLATGRVRPPIRGTRSASVAADGTLYTVDTAGRVVAYARRAPERFAARVEGAAPRLYGATGGRVIALSPGGGELAVLTPRDSARVQPIAEGPVAVTLWGDLLAVAADTAVILYEPLSQREPRSIEMEDGARAVAFSPSGHQLYAGRDDASVAVIDRFGLDVRDEIAVGARLDRLRPGPYGRWLLGYAIGTDSIWVIDLDAKRLAGAVPGTWAADLPVVAASGVLVLRRGKDVVALDLSAPGFPERGRVADGAGDLWAAPPWAPPGVRAPEPADDEPAPAPSGDEGGDDAEPAADAGPAAGDSAGTDTARAERVYLQVSSSRNPEWARELSDKLVAAGLPARVLEPRTPTDPYRVVLGPYASREAAEEAGRSLGMPYFVVGAGDSAAP
ncbi:MAG TPA: SPOR domain-containing protein [Gemmatimonadales bacterium]